MKSGFTGAASWQSLPIIQSISSLSLSLQVTVMIPGSYCLAVSLPIVVGTIPLSSRNRNRRNGAAEAAPTYQQEINARLVTLTLPVVLYLMT